MLGQFEEQDRTTDVLLIILTVLLAVSAAVFYPIFQMFPFWDIWTYIFVSIELGFILILILGVRSSIKKFRWFFIIVNSICIILISALIFLFLVPRGIA
jgi:hypothetical protein